MDDWDEEDEEEKRLQEYHEFCSDFGSTLTTFVGRWTMMFTKPPSQQVRHQWKDMHDHLWARMKEAAKEARN